MTNQEALDQFKDYLENEKQYATLTVKSYVSDITDFSSFVTNEGFASHVLDITRERIFGHYMNHLSSLSFSNKSIARKISALKAFYKYHHRRGNIEVNVTLSLKAPKMEKRLPKVISDQEINLIYKSIEKDKPLGQRNYLIFDLLYSTGIRASELCQLKLQDLEIGNKRILIHGKGSKDRYVLIHDQLVETFKNYLTYTRPTLMAKGETLKNNQVFINYKGGNLTTRGLRVILNQLFEKAGEYIKVSPHMIRHSFASTLLSHGADLRVVQELLGHEHLKTTQIYTHLTTESIKKAYKESHPRTKK